MVESTKPKTGELPVQMTMGSPSEGIKTRRQFPAQGSPPGKSTSSRGEQRLIPARHSRVRAGEGLVFVAGAARHLGWRSRP